MSMAGLKKQFHKASQLLKEKIGGVEGTKLEEDFTIMEKKTAITNKLVVDLVSRTTEHLQPNPTHRAKLSLLSQMSKMRGDVRPVGYPHTEGMLGDCMLTYGADLGEESAFGSALVETGQALKQMTEVRDCMDLDVKHNFIEPLQRLHDRELKEISLHLKKLEGRRLDFDYKKSSKRRFAEAELKQASDKFEESKDLAERSMLNLLENDVEQVQQLLGLIDALMNYHQQSHNILENLRSSLQNKITDTASDQRGSSNQSLMQVQCVAQIPMHFPQVHPLVDTELTEDVSEKSNCNSTLDQPCCRALFNFQPENQSELGFKKGENIILINQVDENWFEGMHNGKSGFFPVNYVEVLIPLPNDNTAKEQ